MRNGSGFNQTFRRLGAVLRMHPGEYGRRSAGYQVKAWPGSDRIFLKCGHGSEDSSGVCFKPGLDQVDSDFSMASAPRVLELYPRRDHFKEE